MPKKQEIPNIRGGYIKCSCPKTHSKYYCDSVYELINMIQNKKIIHYIFTDSNNKIISISR